MMYRLYQKNLMLPSDFYEMKENRKGEYKILLAFMKKDEELEKEEKGSL